MCTECVVANLNILLFALQIEQIANVEFRYKRTKRVTKRWEIQCTARVFSFYFIYFSFHLARLIQMIVIESRYNITDVRWINGKQYEPTDEKKRRRRDKLLKIYANNVNAFTRNTRVYSLSVEMFVHHIYKYGMQSKCANKMRLYHNQSTVFTLKKCILIYEHASAHSQYHYQRDMCVCSLQSSTCIHPICDLVS